MIKIVNGKVIKMTDEEISELEKSMQEQAARAEAAEKKRPLTQEEVSRMLIAQQINTLSVDDAAAYRMREFYPAWEDVIGKAVDAGGGVTILPVCKVSFGFVTGGSEYPKSQKEEIHLQ